MLRTISAACRLAARGRPDPDETEARLVNELTSAVGEAFNNIALHGYRGGPTPGVVRVDVDIGNEWITVELRDFGTSFDPTAVPTPDLGGDIEPVVESLPESGMGIFIVKSFVEQATYLPGSPNVLTLTKRIAGG